MMKQLIISILLFFGVPTLASPPLITDALELGCGWSDVTYDYIVSTLKEKSTSSYSIRSKGIESGRRIYLYSDRSWFLTLEFLNPGDIQYDVSCIVDHGAGEESERAFEYPSGAYPDWKWGNPAHFPHN